MERFVYLSYSGRNCEAVLQVMEGIIRHGYGLVCDCLLPARESFAERVSRAIRQAETVIAVITDDAADCTYMDRELEYALAAGKRVVPIVVDGAQLPPKYAQALRRMERLQVSEYPTEQEIEAVMAAISQ